MIRIERIILIYFNSAKTNPTHDQVSIRPILVREDQIYEEQLVKEKDSAMKAENEGNILHTACAVSYYLYNIINVEVVFGEFDDALSATYHCNKHCLLRTSPRHLGLLAG